MDEPTPPTPPSPNPALPQVAGYRLLRELGRGGMATVYLAEQTALGREVALKVMSPQALGDEISRRRFENEVRTIARLEHPNIVRIHELGRTRDGLPYYSMPHLARGHLGGRDFTRDEPGAVSMATSLLSALEYAHSRGVVHRDVKPENVLFDDAGRPLLADFGIALRRGFGPRVTAAGLAVGSTAYMAPEQARGEDVDGRADLYSLGVVLWEMLAGRLPYEAQDALSMALMHAQDPIPKLPRPLRHWQRFMLRALAKNADQRFQTAADMREAMLAVRPSRLKPLADRAAALAVSRPGRRAALALGFIAILAATATLWPRDDGDGFYRGDAVEPAPAVSAASEAADPDVLPPPGARLEAALENARAQMARGELFAPEGDNAMTSVLAAWHEDPTDPRVRESLDALAGAFSRRIVANVRDRDDTRARDLFARADAFAQSTGQVGAPAQIALRESAARAAVARAEAAAKRGDGDAAKRAVALAGDFGLPRDALARLEKQVAASIEPKAKAASEARSQEPARGSIAPRPVSRADYQRFAEATGRAAALCRERASLLRMVAPRDWRNPGFEQSQDDPVVCVSLQDAEAYALWQGQQSGRRYRLPTSEESAAAPAQFGARTVGLWLRDCGASCLQRQVTGGSWRGRAAQRPLQANRGYDDVGFRLVRER